MALKRISIAAIAICASHLAAGQTTATTWPPSTAVPSGFSKQSPVPACSGTAAPPNGFGTLPTSLFSGIQADLADQNSEISRMIQSTCSPDYASHQANYGSCNNNVCKFAMSTAEYNATYTTNTFSGQLDFCLGAPFFLVDYCHIASGSSASPVGGSYASNFNGGGSELYQSYTFAITPSGQPFAQCTGDQWNTNEQANVLLAFQALCAADACQLPGEQFGCDRNITQGDYVIQAHRQNYGSNSFPNCGTALDSIIGECYEKGKGGGTWAAASQEYYALTFSPAPPDSSTPDEI